MKLVPLSEKLRVDHSFLTNRQTDILLFIAKYHGTNGYPPSVREIGEAVGLSSPSSVQHHLVELERQGHLSTRDQTPRTLRLVLPEPTT